jgi:twitching motility two-component system response regulator PilH
LKSKNGALIMVVKTILVVDDSPTERTFLEGILTKAGFSVIQAASGEEGVEAAKRDQPDLVLMDVVMPGLNGFQETTKHIPVFICTTKDQETDKIWGMRQGAKDYLVKPVSAADLIAKIKALG